MAWTSVAEDRIGGVAEYDQRALMGYVSGWMYLAVGLFGLVGLTVPALRFHPVWQFALGGAAILYGALTVMDVPRWGHRPLSAHMAAMVVALPVIALAVWATGGAHSYLRPMLLLAPIHWGFFVLRRSALAALCAGLILTLWSPLLYQPSAGSQAMVALTATLSVTIVCMAASMALIRLRLLAVEKELRRLTTIDPLTGLLNRRGFERELRGLVAGTPDGHTPFMVLLDLDALKALNDNYGHTAGDQALSTFAERLRSAAREGDLLARIGGDEFAVAGHAAGSAMIGQIAARLTLASSAELDGVGVHISATSGWAAASPEGEGGQNSEDVIDGMYRQADERLLANKRSLPRAGEPDEPRDHPRYGSPRSAAAARSRMGMTAATVA